MKHLWICEVAALALIAERIGGAQQAAANEYFEAGRDGQLVVKATTFGPPFGIDERPVARGVWASAVFRPDPGAGFDSWRAMCRTDPVYFLEPACHEAGGNRLVRQDQIDALWPSRAPPAVKEKTPGSVAARRRRILDALERIDPTGECRLTMNELVLGHAVRQKLGVPEGAKGYSDRTIVRLAKQSF